MRGVWTVARHTFSQVLRMKVAGLFLLLLALSLTVLPYTMKGDSSLAGRIRTFLSHSIMISGGLLSLVTIFVSTAVVTSDVQGKQIFQVVTKPLGRWQYVVGRWLGVTLLNTLLVAIVGLSIYALAQHMRSRPALNPGDRRAVETEVFTARRQIAPDSTDEEVARRVGARLQGLKQAGEYEGTLRSFQERDGSDRAGAESALIGEIRKQERERAQSTPPGGSLFWRFSDIRVAGETLTGPGRVEIVRKDIQGVRIQTETSLVAQLIYLGPVRVQGTDARVMRLGDGYFDAQFTIEDMKRPSIAKLAAGDEVSLEIDPTLQITYQVDPAGGVPNREAENYWRVLNRDTGFQHFEPRRQVSIDLPATLTVSARVVDDSGATFAQYVNLSPASVAIPPEDISLLYQEGRFDWNLLRGLLLLSCQLAFLGALGVLAGTFLTFPVACLLCFGVLPFCMMRQFLTEAVSMYKTREDPVAIVANGIIKGMSFLVPDFSDTSPGDSLAEGLNLTWPHVARTAGLVLVLQTGALLALACLVFRRRELARVQA
jgi:hypothetical protein